MTRHMTRAIVLIAFLTALLSSVFMPGIGSMTGSALAADVSVRPAAARPFALPFPRSERAQSVWASGACWSECGSYCAWGEAGCLTRDSQGQCLKLTDTCDRYCQRECRTSGGPWLPIEMPWE
jgi:hypothetical protein